MRIDWTPSGRFEVSSKNTVSLSLKHLLKIKKNNTYCVLSNCTYMQSYTCIHTHIYTQMYIEPLPLGISHLLGWPKSLFRLQTNLNKLSANSIHLKYCYSHCWTWQLLKSRQKTAQEWLSSVFRKQKLRLRAENVLPKDQEKGMLGTDIIGLHMPHMCQWAGRSMYLIHRVPQQPHEAWVETRLQRRRNRNSTK